MVEVREPRLTTALCGLLFLAGWTGSHCEDDINECLPQPCNQGICIQNDPGYGYTCFCRPGFVVRFPTLLLLLFFSPFIIALHPTSSHFFTHFHKFHWFVLTIKQNIFLVTGQFYVFLRLKLELAAKIKFLFSESTDGSVQSMNAF